MKYITIFIMFMFILAGIFIIITAESMPRIIKGMILAALNALFLFHYIYFPWPFKKMPTEWFKG